MAATASRLPNERDETPRATLVLLSRSVTHLDVGLIFSALHGVDKQYPTVRKGPLSLLSLGRGGRCRNRSRGRFPQRHQAVLEVEM
jgi:hypothetical protein